MPDSGSCGKNAVMYYAQLDTFLGGTSATWDQRVEALKERQPERGPKGLAAVDGICSA